MLVFISLLIISQLYTSKLQAAETVYNNVIVLQQKHMIQAGYCSDRLLIEEHIYRLLSVRSKTECAIQCRMDDSCLSMVYNYRNHECQLADSRASENCSNMEPLDQVHDEAIVFYQVAPLCEPGERLDGRGQCVCAPGFTGNPCTRYFHDCSDVYKYGDWKGDGVKTVKPLASSKAFQVFCRHITNTRTYIMQRKKKKKRLNFNRSWGYYKDGFGNLLSDFWLGLEKLHILTSVERCYKLRITIKLFNNSIISYVYDDFKVTNEASGYRLYFNNSVPNGTNDCFPPLFNASFSTYDRDQDENDDVNCAKTRKGGFWFRGENCSTCNPHGIIYGNSDGLLEGATDEAFWLSMGNLAPYKLNMYLVSDEHI